MLRPPLLSNAGRTFAAGVRRPKVRLKVRGARILLELRVPITLSCLLRALLAITLASTLGIARADEDVKDRPQANAVEHREAGRGVLRLLPADAVTEHSIDTPRGKLAYTATAGTLAFYDQSGEQSASVFYTAYVAKDAPPNRPLTFVFNGGP